MTSSNSHVERDCDCTRRNNNAVSSVGVIVACHKSPSVRKKVLQIEFTRSSDLIVDGDISADDPRDQMDTINMSFVYLK